MDSRLHMGVSASARTEPPAWTRQGRPGPPAAQLAQASGVSARCCRCRGTERLAMGEVPGGSQGWGQVTRPNHCSLWTAGSPVWGQLLGGGALGGSEKGSSGDTGLREGELCGGSGRGCSGDTGLREGELWGGPGRGNLRGLREGELWGHGAQGRVSSGGAQGVGALGTRGLREGELWGHGGPGEGVLGGSGATLEQLRRAHMSPRPPPLPHRPLRSCPWCFPRSGGGAPGGAALGQHTQLPRLALLRAPGGL